MEIAPDFKGVIQKLVHETATKAGYLDKSNVPTSIELTAHSATRGINQIDIAGLNMIAWYDSNDGSIELVDLGNKDTQNNSIKYNLPMLAILDKYPQMKASTPAANKSEGEAPAHSVISYIDSNTNKVHLVRGGLDISKEINFEGVDSSDVLVNGPKNIKNIELEERKEISAIFLKTLPEGSKHTGISTEKKYNSTSYNFESKGVQMSFSSLDGEHFYVWGKFGKDAIYTGESFKLSEIDDLKLDVQALKDKFTPKPQDKENPSIPKDNRPYDLSMDNIKEIEAGGAVSSRWGRYKGDRHEIFEAAVWAAKEAKINPNHLVAFIEHESGFNPNTKSPTGAEGLGQFTSGTWNDMVNKYPIRRDGVKHSGLRDAYPELDWGKGTEHREDIVLNALATAHYMRYNMNQRGSDDRNVGYISHNLGPGGCNQFMRNLEKNPNSDCSGDALIKYNPINYTNAGDPLTFRQAYNRIDSHMDNSYGMAVHRGYNPELAKEAVRGQEAHVNNPPANPKDNSTSQIGDDLKQNGVQEYRGEGVLPQEVMDKALAMAQTKAQQTGVGQA